MFPQIREVFFLTVKVFLLSVVEGQKKKASTYDFLHMCLLHVLENFMHAASKRGGLVVYDGYITCVNFSVANQDQESAVFMCLQKMYMSLYFFLCGWKKSYVSRMRLQRLDFNS